MGWITRPSHDGVYLYSYRNDSGFYLLLQIGEGLGVSEALAGQLVTLYALGSLLAAIPLTTVTRGWRRRPLLLMCILGFLIFNTVTTFSSNYILTLTARFFAGVSAGVLWG